MILHDAPLKLTNIYCSPLSGGLFLDFSCFNFMNASAASLSFLCRALIITRTVSFLSTVTASDVVKVSLGLLHLVFFFTFIITSFTTLCEHKLISDTVVLVLTIIIIVRLVI